MSQTSDLSMKNQQMALPSHWLFVNLPEHVAAAAKMLISHIPQVHAMMLNYNAKRYNSNEIEKKTRFWDSLKSSELGKLIQVQTWCRFKLVIWMLRQIFSSKLAAYLMQRTEYWTHETLVAQNSRNLIYHKNYLRCWLIQIYTFLGKSGKSEQLTETLIITMATAFVNSEWCQQSNHVCKFLGVILQSHVKLHTSGTYQQTFNQKLVNSLVPIICWLTAEMVEN